jgi:hypothetical protein
MYVINIWQGQYQIAVGHDNTAGLRGLEGIVVAPGVRPFTVFKGWGNYNPGQTVIDGLGLESYSGFPTTQWLFAGVLREQVYFLMNTYCGGSYSGLVTVRTSTDQLDGNGDPVFAVFNAALRLPKLNEIQWRGRKAQNYALTFSRMVAA